MKKIVALAVLGVMLLSGTALAQIPPETTGLVGFNAGYAVSKIKDTDETYPGWGLGLAVDRMVSSRISVGMTLSFVGGHKDITVDDQKLRSSYNALPMAITGKFYFGGDRIMGYVGAGLGVHIGNFKNEIEDTTTNEIERIDRQVTSGAFAIPVGMYILVGNNTYLNLGYLPYFVVDNELIDGATHNFVLGVVGTM